MIRLRVSDLDSWLQYVDPPHEGMGLSTEQFLTRMQRGGAKSAAMLAGSALHKVLETAQAGDEFGEEEGVLQDGVCLRFGISYELALPVEREPEITEHIFHTRYGDVLLRGRIDAREADATVVDYKLSGRFDAERYGRSMQWRAYALMKKAKRFKYLVFQSKQEFVYDDRECFLDVWIHDVHELVQWSYPEMEAEVQVVVSDLAGFVVEHVPALCS